MNDNQRGDIIPYSVEFEMNLIATSNELVEINNSINNHAFNNFKKSKSQLNKIIHYGHKNFNLL